MRLKQNGRTWTAELEPSEIAQLKKKLPELLAPAGEVGEIFDPRLPSIDMEVVVRLKNPVQFKVPSSDGSVWINRDGGGVTYAGSASWYSLTFYPMPMPGDEALTIRVPFWINGRWWPENGANAEFEDVLDQIRKLGEAIAIGWDPIGEPRDRHH